MHPSNSTEPRSSAPAGDEPDVIIHVGTHKTGTTALQEFLAVNDDVLLARTGILYPATGRDPVKHYHHAYFRSLLTENGHVDQALVDELFLESAARGASCLLLSSEFLSRSTIREEELRKIHAAFPRSRLKITVYLRRQDRFLESTYAERVRRGLIAAPDRLPEAELQLDYFEFISKFTNVFGKENVILRVYERACRVGLCRDFLEAHGVAWEPCYAVPEIPRNERLSWAYLELLRHANARKATRKIAVHPITKRMAQVLHRLVPAIMDNPRPLTDSAREQLLATYAASNARLAELFFGNSQLFPE